MIRFCLMWKYNSWTIPIVINIYKVKQLDYQ